MTSIRWHTSMSLDGYVAGPDHAMGWMALEWLPPTDAPGLPPETRRIVEAPARSWPVAAGTTPSPGSAVSPASTVANGRARCWFGVSPMGHYVNLSYRVVR